MWRPQDGETRGFFFSSSALFCRPAYAMSQPTPSVAIANVITCGSKVIHLSPWSTSCERGGALRSTTPVADDRIRGCRARLWPDLRVQAFLEPTGDRRRPPADGSRMSAGAGADGRAPARALLSLRAF